MFVRKKNNRSGTISIVVVSKAHGKFTEVKKFGVAKSEEEVDKMFREAQLWLRTHDGQQELDFDDRKGMEVEATERFLGNIDNVLVNGTQLLLNRVYDSIGFNRIPDEILRHLVIARVSQPRSKLATVDYLKSYYDEDVDLNHIYRYMDKLYNTQMELVQQISVEHTRKIFGGKIGLMFYDVTTLYFETADMDVLREPGFSKDGKTAESQVVLGLLLGILFAIAFCPTSGVLYFGGLIPLSVASSGGYFLPVVFAIATALPVLIVAVIIAFSVESIGRFYEKMQTLQRWMNWIVGGLFVIIGIYYCIIAFS